MKCSIMVLNTGSTSTKMAVYQGHSDSDEVNQVVLKEYTHSKEFLKDYPYMSDQLPMRRKIADEFVETIALLYAPFDAIVARGGILCPINSGGYEINETMVNYLLNVSQEEHASNVAACIAYELAKTHSIPHAYIYDGITTDELEPISRISGIPDMPRVSVIHALNMRATAMKAAKDLEKNYEQATIIVAHLGGGISLSMHQNGKIVDVVGDDEGPFSPERCGGQQIIQLIKYLHGKNSIRDQLKVIRGNSGLSGYFGTNDARDVQKMIDDGNETAKLVYDALAYQIAKAIATLSVVTYGKVDCIVLTGGLARSKRLTDQVAERTGFIASTRVYPGENEMDSLANGAYRILSAKETAQPFLY